MYHVLNRGDRRRRLFHKPGDYDDFVRLLAAARRAVPGVRVLAYCLMPNHWHLVLWPRRDGELSRFMQRLCTAHVRRHHAHHQTGGGHLYQGRYKSFPVQEDGHLLTVLRYVESNPLRARPPLARSPSGWRWCSFAARQTPAGEELLHAWPVDPPHDWAALVAQPLADFEAERVRASILRGRPLGDDRWTTRTASRLGLAHTLRPRGRPRKTPPPDPAATPKGQRVKPAKP